VLKLVNIFLEVMEEKWEVFFVNMMVVLRRDE